MPGDLTCLVEAQQARSPDRVVPSVVPEDSLVEVRNPDTSSRIDLDIFDAVAHQDVTLQSPVVAVEEAVFLEASIAEALGAGPDDKVPVAHEWLDFAMGHEYLRKLNT